MNNVGWKFCVHTSISGCTHILLIIAKVDKFICSAGLNKYVLILRLAICLVEFTENGNEIFDLKTRKFSCVFRCFRFYKSLTFKTNKLYSYRVWRKVQPSTHHSSGDMHFIWNILFIDSDKKTFDTNYFKKNIKSYSKIESQVRAIKYLLLLVRIRFQYK